MMYIHLVIFNGRHYLPSICKQIRASRCSNTDYLEMQSYNTAQLCNAYFSLSFFSNRN